MASGSISGYQGQANDGNTEDIVDGFNHWRKVYNDTGGAVSNGAIYILGTEVDATDTSNPVFRWTLEAAATQDTESNIVAVVDNSPLGLGTIASASYGFVKLRGFVNALCDGTSDLAAGDGLEVINAGTAFIISESASSGELGALVPETAAVILEAYTTNSAALKKVVLLGRQVAIKGS